MITKDYSILNKIDWLKNLKYSHTFEWHSASCIDGSCGVVATCSLPCKSMPSLSILTSLRSSLKVFDDFGKTAAGGAVTKIIPDVDGRRSVLKFKARPRIDSISSLDTIRLRSFDLITLATVEPLIASNLRCSDDSVTISVVTDGSFVTSLTMSCVGSLSLSSDGSWSSILVSSIDASVLVNEVAVLASYDGYSVVNSVDDDSVDAAVVAKFVNFAAWPKVVFSSSSIDSPDDFADDVDEISILSVVNLVSSVGLASTINTINTHENHEHSINFVMGNPMKISRFICHENSQFDSVFGDFCCGI